MTCFHTFLSCGTITNRRSSNIEYSIKIKIRIFGYQIIQKHTALARYTVHVHVPWQVQYINIFTDFDPSSHRRVKEMLKHVMYMYCIEVLPTLPVNFSFQGKVQHCFFEYVYVYFNLRFQLIMLHYIESLMRKSSWCTQICCTFILLNANFMKYFFFNSHLR